MARSTTANAASTSTRNRAVLLVAAVFGILSAALMFAFLNSRDGGDSAADIISAGGAAESVVVVTRDIGVGEQITSDMLTTRTVPAAALLNGRVTESDDVVGKVATAPLFAGEQVVEAKVTTFSEQNTLSYKVPDNMRAVSMQIPHEAWVAAGLVQPGDRLDVLGITILMTVDPLTGQEKPDFIAGYIAQDVEVLAVAQSLIKYVPNLDERARDAEAGGGGTTLTDTQLTGAQPSDEDPEARPGAVSITLALPPDLAAKVALIDAIDDAQGQYRLLPRQKGDETQIDGQLTWSYEDLFAPVN